MWCCRDAGRQLLDNSDWYSEAGRVGQEPGHSEAPCCCTPGHMQPPDLKTAVGCVHSFQATSFPQGSPTINHSISQAANQSSNLSVKRSMTLAVLEANRGLTDCQKLNDQVMKVIKVPYTCHKLMQQQPTTPYYIQCYRCWSAVHCQVMCK